MQAFLNKVECETFFCLWKQVEFFPQMADCFILCSSDYIFKTNTRLNDFLTVKNWRFVLIWNSLYTHK